MPRTIIVSDLHFDTWQAREQYGTGDRKMTKLEHWHKFLDWCEAERVAELVINGDLIDAPPYKGNTSFTDEIERSAVDHLVKYAACNPVTYVHGNHDIGISGIRCRRENSLPALRNVNLFYPGHVLDTGSTTLLIQHGHLYDPVLWQYVADLEARTYMISRLEAFQWVMQRRHPERGTRLEKRPGVGEPSAIGLGPQVENNVYYAIKMSEAEAPALREDILAGGGWLRDLKNNMLTAVEVTVKHVIWWLAARQVFRLYLKNYPQRRRTIYCIMGHTHVPDTAEFQIRGNHCIYFNSGTWTGKGRTKEDRQHATYLDVDEQGKVWIQDWIRNPS
jgi:UDP-2,3-diacylglucosamine pyrophosphatase LpxH